MSNVELIAEAILRSLLENFRAQDLNASALESGYTGVSLVELAAPYQVDGTVDFDLALKELEEKKAIDTGPMAPYENEPGSGFFMIGSYSRRQYAFLTEKGYKQALKVGAPPASKKRPAQVTTNSEAQHFYGIHPAIREKCGSLYEASEYAEAVEKSFKVVRDRLRALTGYETGSEAFGKGHLHIDGAVAAHVDADFNQAVKFLTMAIDMFRNEKSHTSDAKIEDPIRAHQYLSLSSLAMYLLENAQVRRGA